jgi:hypothetical protein
MRESMAEADEITDIKSERVQIDRGKMQIGDTCRRESEKRFYPDTGMT